MHQPKIWVSQLFVVNMYIQHYTCVLLFYDFIVPRLTSETKATLLTKRTWNGYKALNWPIDLQWTLAQSRNIKNKIKSTLVYIQLVYYSQEKVHTMSSVGKATCPLTSSTSSMLWPASPRMLCMASQAATGNIWHKLYNSLQTEKIKIKQSRRD